MADLMTRVLDIRESLESLHESVHEVRKCVLRLGGRWAQAVADTKRVEERSRTYRKQQKQLFQRKEKELEERIRQMEGVLSKREKDGEMIRTNTLHTMRQLRRELEVEKKKVQAAKVSEREAWAKVEDVKRKYVRYVAEEGARVEAMVKKFEDTKEELEMQLQMKQRELVRVRQLRDEEIERLEQEHANYVQERDNHDKEFSAALQANSLVLRKFQKSYSDIVRVAREVAAFNRATREGDEENVQCHTYYRDELFKLLSIILGMAP